MYECFSVCMSVSHMPSWSLWRPERALDLLGTGVRDSDKPAMQVLGIIPRFFGRVASILNHGAPKAQPS